MLSNFIEDTVNSLPKPRGGGTKMALRVLRCLKTQNTHYDDEKIRKFVKRNVPVVIFSGHHLSSQCE